MRGFTREQAYLLKGRLQAEQIPAFLLDEHANAGLPINGDSFAGLRVQVPDEHVKDAEAVLRDIRDTTSQLPETESEPFTSQAQPVLTLLNYIDIVFCISFIVALLYRFIAR